MDPRLRQSMQLPQSVANRLSLHSSAVTPGLISIEDFTTRVRPADVTVQIVDFKKKYLGASVSIDIGLTNMVGIRH